MRKIQFNDFVWIDIDPDNDEDIKSLEATIPLKSSTEQILRSPLHLQRLEEFPEYIAIVLQYPLYNKELRKNSGVELDCILTPGYLITAHRKEIHFLQDILSKAEHGKMTYQNPVALYTQIVETMLDSCLTPLNRIAERIEYIEDEIFRGNERHMINEISIVKRDVLDFRKIIRLHKAVIDLSFKLAPHYFPKTPLDSKTITDILATNIHIWNITENLKEAIEAFDDTNQTLLSHKLNENIKTLTIFSTTLAPATLVAGLLGINARMDFLSSPIAFFVVVMITLALSLGLYGYFRYKDLI